MRSKHLMGGLAALMLSALLAITLISNSQRKASPSVKIMLNFPETREPFRVFRGQELCAEGESYCEHPCDAFYTVTGKPTDCFCKCTVNPHSFAKGDVICTCPDSPISSENDFYPHPPNVTNATEAPAAEGASTQARAERPIILRSMALPRRASLLISPYNVPAFAQEQPPRGLSYKWAAAPPLFAGPAAFAPTARRSPQGLWVGAPPPMNPPNGDYPGGSSGIPLDGYIGFDTGYMEDGPYHGMYEPLLDAGLYAGRARRPQFVAAPRPGRWA